MIRFPNWTVSNRLKFVQWLKLLGIQFYWTFLLFKCANVLKNYYHSYRWVDAHTNYVTKIADTTSEQHLLTYQVHEGSILRGHVTINRVYGNFHVISESDSHIFNPNTICTSPIVHSLSCGTELPEDIYMLVHDDVWTNMTCVLLITMGIFHMTIMSRWLGTSRPASVQSEP